MVGDMASSVAYAANAEGSMETTDTCERSAAGQGLAQDHGTRQAQQSAHQPDLSCEQSHAKAETAKLEHRDAAVAEGEAERRVPVRDLEVAGCSYSVPGSAASDACNNTSNNRHVSESFSVQAPHVSDSGVYEPNMEDAELSDGENSGNAGELDSDESLESLDSGDTDDSGADSDDEDEVRGNINPNMFAEPHRREQLAGPDRIRRRQVRERRQVGQRTISVAGAVLDRWRQIGAQWGLSNDNDIARVLLQHYEDVQAGRPPRPPPAPRCLGCGQRLVPRPCDACGPNEHSNRLSHDRGDGGVGGSASGADRYCGRCRD